MAKTKTSFNKGQGGRKKGVPNKTTGTLRQWISKFVEDNTEQFQGDWLALEPKERVIMYEKLLKYSIPSLQAVSTDIRFEDMTEAQLDYIIEKLKNEPTRKN